MGNKIPGIKSMMAIKLNENPKCFLNMTI